jgi:DNA adenine methylase
MPYTIRKVRKGYKVCKKDEPSKCFSKKPLSEERAKKQKIAIILSEQRSMEGGLKPITARIGGKVLLKKKLVDEYFPNPSTYDTYVEPFVGAGSVYFYKNKDGKKEVINDIDPDMYILLKGLQTYDAHKLAEDINGDYTSEDFKDIKNSNPKTPYKIFLKTYLLYKLSFFGRGLTFGKSRVNTSFEGYKERLKDVIITKTDYKDVINKYNKADAFFYLDPPATESSGKYHFNPINISELVSVLKSIKGKFLLSLPTTKLKKKLFEGFKVITVPTKYVGEKTLGGQSKKVKEYLIANYNPSMEGGCSTCAETPMDASPLQGLGIRRIKKKKMCGGCMGDCGGEVSEFQEKLNSIGLKPSVYLSKARELAKHTGYDPSKLEFCNTGNNKLMYESPDGLVHFGAPKYHDYIIYSFLESKGEVEKGTADKRRDAYRARATNIKGNWKKNKYSPNNMAINILW